MRMGKIIKLISKRILATVVAASMMISVIPCGVTVFAEENEIQDEAEIVEEIEEETEEEILEETVSENTVGDDETELVTIEIEGALQFGDYDIPEVSIETVPAEGISAEGHVYASTVFRKIYRSLLAYDSYIDISQYHITESRINSIYASILNEHSDLYYVGSSLSYAKCAGYVAKLYPTYNGKNESWATSFNKEKYNKGVNDCLECVNDSMSDLEKVVAVHEWIILNCTYDYDSLEKLSRGSISDRSCYSSYGVFAKRAAVCQGYALAYKLIMNCIGIDCYYVTNRDHAWNLVKINGEYYHVDTTWDDPNINADDTYAQKYGFVRHDNLLRSDTGIQATGHSGYRINGMSNQNVATSTKYDSYFWQESHSRLVGTESGWLYVDYKKGVIGKFTRSSGNKRTLKCLPTWTIKGTKYYYEEAFSMLAEKNGVVYYNTPDNIISMNQDGSNAKTVYTNSSSTKSIWGFVIENGKFIIDLDTDVYESCQGTVINIPSAAATPPTELILDATDLKLAKGTTWTIGYSYYPSYATAPKVTYTSSNTDVATINSSGVLSANKKGTATITATAGSLKDTLYVTVVDISSKPKSKVKIDDGLSEIIGNDGQTYNCDKARRTEIVLEDNDSSAAIYYTLDGTEPSENSNVYSGPILLENSAVVKYMAVSSGLTKSETGMITIRMVDCSFKVTPDGFQMDNKSTADVQIAEVPELLTYSDISITADSTYLEINKDEISKGIIHVKALKPGNTTLTLSCKPCSVGTKEEYVKIEIIPAKIPVYFYDPYGNLIDEQRVDEGTGADEPQFSIPTGYEFNGWDNSFDCITDVTEVHAKPYVLKNYSITYLGLPEGSDYTPSALSYTVEDEVVIKAAADMDDTHIFTGWNIKENGSGAEVNVIRRGSHGDLTLYAQYAYVGGLRVDPIEDKYYTGKKIKPAVVVRYDDRVLKEGKDYKVKYSNNKKPGTATVTIKGKGSYTGKDTTTFRIINDAIPDGDIASAKVSLRNCIFNGMEQRDNEDAQLTMNVNGITTTLIKDEDYVIESHTDNVNAGRATIVYRGIGEYSGKLVKTYRISPYNIGGHSVTIYDLGEQPYEKDGSTPDVKITFIDGNCDEITLKRGTDYTLSFSKNNKLSKRGCITIYGKGNFEGKLKNRVFFNITRSSLQNLPIQNCTGYDIFETGIAGGYNTRVEIIDTNGKKLSSKSDYRLTDRYFDSEGRLLTSDYVPTVGETLYAEVEGKGYYTGSIKVSYKVVDSKNNIGNALIILKSNLRKEYTGKQIKLLPGEITVYHNGEELTYGEDYKIVYANNISKGKATATVIGIGEYGGRKTVKFNIEAMRIRWGE